MFGKEMVQAVVFALVIAISLGFIAGMAVSYLVDRGIL